MARELASWPMHRVQQRVVPIVSERSHAHFKSDVAVTLAHGHAVFQREIETDFGATIGQESTWRPRNLSSRSNLQATPTARFQGQRLLLYINEIGTMSPHIGAT